MYTTMIRSISDRQLEIIEAAGKILTASGLSGLTIKNLAKEMKFSESAIYRHFESKEDIILTLLEYLAKDMEDRFSRVITEERSPEEKFKTIFRGQFSFFTENPHFVVAVFSDGLIEESQKINEKIIRIMSVKMKHLMPIIKEGQNENIFTNSVSTEDLLNIVMGTFRLQIFKWRVANFDFDIRIKGDHMIESLLILIRNKSN